MLGSGWHLAVELMPREKRRGTLICHRTSTAYAEVITSPRRQTLPRRLHSTRPAALHHRFDEKGFQHGHPADGVHDEGGVGGSRSSPARSEPHGALQRRGASFASPCPELALPQPVTSTHSPSAANNILPPLRALAEYNHDDEDDDGDNDDDDGAPPGA